MKRFIITLFLIIHFIILSRELKYHFIHSFWELLNVKYLHSTKSLLK